MREYTVYRLGECSDGVYRREGNPLFKSKDKKAVFERLTEYLPRGPFDLYEVEETSYRKGQHHKTRIVWNWKELNE